jgi:hypothetical protein
VKTEKNKNYFDGVTQEHIEEFQAEPDLEKKKVIFVKHIKPSFDKLIENVIFVYKFHTGGDVDMMKNDCLSFLFEILNKFDASKGSKAFSYFNVVAKNWFIQRGKTINGKSRLNVVLDKTTIDKIEKKDSELKSSFEEEVMHQEFLLLLKDEIEKWKIKFDKKQERIVLEAVTVLFENPDLVPMYNKKAILMYLREMTDLNTKQIITNLKKFKKKYTGFRGKYFSGKV